MSHKSVTVSKSPRVLRHKWLLIGLIIILLVLALLPVAIRYAAQSWLLGQGMQQVVIKDINLNLFAGSFEISGVNLEGKAKGSGRLEQLEVNISMLALLQQRIDIQELNISGIEIDIHQNKDSGITIAGISLPAPAAAQQQDSAKEQSGWGFGIESIALNNIQINMDAPSLKTKLLLSKFSLGRVAMWLPQKAATYNLLLKIDNTPLLINGRLQPFGATPAVNAQLKLDQLALGMFAALAQENGISQLQGKLSLLADVKVEADKSGAATVSVSGSFDVRDLGFNEGPRRLQVKNISWQGETSYMPARSETDLGVRSKGTIDVSNFSLKDADTKTMLASFDKMQVKNIHMEQDQKISVDSIATKALHLLAASDGSEPITQVKEIMIEKIQFDGVNKVEIDSVVTRGLLADIAVDTDGNIKVMEQQTAGKKITPVDAEPAIKSEADPVILRLRHFEIKDDNRISFLDKSISPEYKANIKPFHLLVTDIDSGDKDKDAVISFDATLNEFEKISLNARVKPFAEKLNLTAESKIESMELPPLSPYAGKYVGYHLKRGQLNADITASVKEDQLSSKIKLKLNKFNLQGADQEKVDAMTESLAMPLDTALDLLRDKDGNVLIDLEIDGDINDPQFDINKVINRALANGTKMAVTTYVKLALQPWSTFFAIAKVAGKAAALRFEPVVFAPGEIALGREQQQYMAKIAAMLKERPGLNLNICGQPSHADVVTETAKEKSGKQPQATQEELNARLITLASERGQAVKRLLVEQGLEPARLFVCQPVISKPEKTPPSVELFL